MRFFNITENGSGRIHFNKSPADIAGFTIKGLETCTGIVIFGDKGVSVIHDESFLSIESIDEEFKHVGKINEWSIFYNPNLLKGNELADRYESMAHIINKYKISYISGNEKGSLREAISGCIKVEKTKNNISDVITDPIIIPIIEPKEANLRKAIRRLNNMYAYLSKSKNNTFRIVPVDIQFDSMQQTDPPKLICDDHYKLEQMVRIEVQKWGDKKQIQQYLDYCTVACKSHNTSADGKMFKIQLSAQDKFKALKIKYDKNKDPNMLLQLVELAHNASQECANSSNDYEGAEYFAEQSAHYLKAALNSEDKSVRKAAEEIEDQSASDKAQFDEASDHSQKNSTSKLNRR